MVRSGSQTTERPRQRRSHGRRSRPFTGRRPWTPLEDICLLQALVEFAPGTYQRWMLVSERVGISAKACRNRAAFLNKPNEREEFSAKKGSEFSRVLERDSREDPDADEFLVEDNAHDRFRTAMIRRLCKLFERGTHCDDEESDMEDIYYKRCIKIGFTVADLKRISFQARKAWDDDALA